MVPLHDSIQIAIDTQLGGVFSQNSFNPELLITSAIDQKYYRRNSLTQRIIILVLEGYTQAEIGAFLGISQQHVGKLMRKIPVSDPYIVGGMKGTPQRELEVFRMRVRKAKHVESESYPDLRAWTSMSEGGYLRRRFQTSDRQLEQD